MTPGQLALVGLAGFAAGAVNALAGGGTLLTFPALLSVGLPAVAANVTSTIALCPGYLGATLAQRVDLAGQGGRVRMLLPAALAGGAAGAALLLHTSAARFVALIPWLLLAACALLTLQEPLRTALALRLARGARAADVGAEVGSDFGPRGAAALALLPGVVAASVYGGYFGAGMSVVLLAVLGIGCSDTLPRLNALKQLLAFGANAAAATWLALRAAVDWRLVAVLAGAALLGGAIGGRLARRLPARWLRRLVVFAGLVLALRYLLRPG
jgi:uncharacterized membrane protein YfcA